jgi:hypothetical protein
MILIAMAAKDRSDARVARAVEGPMGAGAMPIPLLRRQSSSISIMVERAASIVDGATAIITSKFSSEQVRVNAMAMVTALVEVCAVDGEAGASFLAASGPLDALLAAVLPFVTSASGTLLSLPAVQMVSLLLLLLLLLWLLFFLFALFYFFYLLLIYSFVCSNILFSR